ncbi:MAG: GNAT family N-acetyltransferase [Planctomycetaceae bacterium]
MTPLFHIRSSTPDDRYAIAELIYTSINVWYLRHGFPPIFTGGPHVTEVFFDVYQATDPDCCFIAENPRTGQMMGSCFYHPRPQHVSLGIMTVHPNYQGARVGSGLVKAIIDYTESHDYKALRLTQSACNLDSFSLYNRAGFVPRHAYQDMYLAVPEAGLPFKLPAQERIRPARLDDIPAMVELENDLSGITREVDYRYCLDNELGFWKTYVVESAKGGLDGFLIASGHAAVNILGPGVTRDDETAAALLLTALNSYPGRTPVFLIPVERDRLVRQMYDWGARNCELHFCQVRGEHQPFRGVNLPSFLPETG